MTVRILSLLLALVFVPMSAGAKSAKHAKNLRKKQHDFVGVEKCSTCHEKSLMGNQVKVWSEGPHRRAFQTLASDASVAIAKQLGFSEPPQQSADCLRCHVTAYGVSPVRIADPVLPSDGVQCESCHGPGRDYRKKKIMADRDVAMRKGLWDAGADEAICVACHNAESPTFDPKRYVRPDGSTAAFDFEMAKTRFPHAIPADVKGRFIELEEAEKAAEKASSLE